MKHMVKSGAPHPCAQALHGAQHADVPPCHIALQKSEPTLSSSRVKPLPRRDLVLYLTVWPRTTGFRLPATGLGKTFLALSARAVFKIKGPQRQDPDVVAAAAIETEA